MKNLSTSSWSLVGVYFINDLRWKVKNYFMFIWRAVIIRFRLKSLQVYIVVQQQ